MAMQEVETVAADLPGLYRKRLGDPEPHYGVFVALVTRPSGFWCVTCRPAAMPNVSVIVERGTVKSIFLARVRFAQLQKGKTHGNAEGSRSPA